jgi:hypothetical protein
MNWKSGYLGLAGPQAVGALPARLKKISEKYYVDYQRLTTF